MDTQTSTQRKNGSIRWCAIGDSFTYLNDHPDETGGRVKEGYVSRTARKVGGLTVINLGRNGSATPDWLEAELPEAELYTVLLGTNDWHGGVPLGTEEDFRTMREGTILGNLGVLLSHIRQAGPNGKVIVMNPVERGDFVYILDPMNHAHGSYVPDQGQRLCDIAKGIFETCRNEGIPVLDLHGLSGFSPETAVRFKRVKTAEGYRDLVWPEYVGVPVDHERDEYPYPPEAADYTYDGLHPSDKGNEVIACLLAEKIREVLRQDQA
ncbi:MAG TPA: SGNH/GDSL hydrolase family protein [Candidatus Eisenbergiella merdavium]|uniref:SGNH/GDSL hydrolase family protein n=1 Tax=Candidatus Eisenbergiella merdavium TaxID=2838551 RepID=A0A9D2NF12_9FIRM|nr:SGNH/GDSL hydrolase family protein [Candidatus Eisenbergiella merdavium]